MKIRFKLENISSPSRGLQEADYVSLIWTTFAEFPGTVVAIFLIDWLGRKKTLAICALSFAISTLVVMSCGYDKTLLVRTLITLTSQLNHKLSLSVEIAS